MKPLLGLLVGAVGLVMMCTTLTQGQSRHVTEAVAHAEAAVAQGKQGYPDALVTQAKEALKQAELAKKEVKNSRLEESIRLLKDAIDQGKQGHSETATQSAERALAHLRELTQPSAETAQGDAR